MRNRIIHDERKHSFVCVESRKKNWFHLISPFDYRTLIQIKSTLDSIYLSRFQFVFSVCFHLLLTWSGGYLLNTSHILIVNRLFGSKQTLTAKTDRARVSRISASIRFHTMNTQTYMSYHSLCFQPPKYLFLLFDFLRWTFEASKWMYYLHWNVKRENRIGSAQRMTAAANHHHRKDHQKLECLAAV